MKPGTIGLLTEMKAQHLLVSLGAEVLLPVGAGTPYDLVVHSAGRFTKVQIKTGKWSDLVGLRFHSYVGAQRRPLTPDDCDAILVYSREEDSFYVARPNGRAESTISRNKMPEMAFKSVGQLFEIIAPPDKSYGVHYFKRTGTWAVTICHRGQRYSFGSYRDHADAVLVADEARRALEAGEPIDGIGRRKATKPKKGEVPYRYVNQNRHETQDCGQLASSAESA